VVFLYQGEGKMANVKWIKICTDIFNDEKIILIEGLPEADSIIVIWFKLLCLAGKQNNGGVFLLNDKIAYTDEMLATIFRKPLNTVRLALNTFENYGMIEIVNNTITIPNWEKHQNLDRLEQAKEKTRLRVAKYREKQKLLTEGNANCNASVTESNADRIEEDKEKDKEEDKDKKHIYVSVISHLNEKAETNYRATSKATKSHINARLSEGYTLDDFISVIDKKCAEWKGTNMEKYLRPETLFGSKFEGYLNAPASNFVENGNIVIINDKKYEYRNGKYYIPNGNGVPVDPYADTSLF
jgi:predicted phage replisome organizer/uncharacterized phage protein (TIGR02220 family)